jgi:hypothetical protein
MLLGHQMITPLRAGERRLPLRNALFLLCFDTAPVLYEL